MFVDSTLHQLLVGRPTQCCRTLPVIGENCQPPAQPQLCSITIGDGLKNVQCVRATHRVHINDQRSEVRNRRQHRSGCRQINTTNDIDIIVGQLRDQGNALGFVALQVHDDGSVSVDCTTHVA